MCNLHALPALKQECQMGTGLIVLKYVQYCAYIYICILKICASIGICVYAWNIWKFVYPCLLVSIYIYIHVYVKLRLYIYKYSSISPSPFVKTAGDSSVHILYYVLYVYTCYSSLTLFCCVFSIVKRKQFWERKNEQSNNKLQENGKVEKSKNWWCTWSNSKSRKVEQFPLQPFIFCVFEILSDVFLVEHAQVFFFLLRAHPSRCSMLLLCLKMTHPPF